METPLSTKIIANAWAVGVSSIILSISFGCATGILVALLKLFRVVG